MQLQPGGYTTGPVNFWGPMRDKEKAERAHAACLASPGATNVEPLLEKRGHWGDPVEHTRWTVRATLRAHLDHPGMAYSARVLDKAEAGWPKCRVGVFRGEEQIGAYDRNYGLGKTFEAFRFKGLDYALYSPHYTTTRILTLPSCSDLGGEDPAGGGFCPVEYYVPISPLTGESIGMGFVAGCVWGDDSSWKIQFLDLSRADEGIVKRDDRFGYVEIPAEMSLKQAVRLDWGEYELEEPWPWIEIVQSKSYQWKSGKSEAEDTD